MKFPAKNSVVIAAILSAAGMAGLILAHAQETGTSIQPAPADDIVQLTADEAGLTPMSSAGLPRGSTYWVIMPGYRGNVTPLPYPCLPVALTNSPIYDITGSIFLVDATGGQVFGGGNLSGAQASSTTIASVLALQANTIENLILMVQGAALLSTSASMSDGMSPMGGDFTPNLSPQSGVPFLIIGPTGTNQLLITVLNDASPANYELWWTPVLADPAYPWTVVAAGTTGQTNFTVNIGPYFTGFYRAIWDTNSVPLWELADPNNTNSGVLNVWIDSPANGTTLN
jgi:hypothetical protein